KAASHFIYLMELLPTYISFHNGKFKIASTTRELDYILGCSSTETLADFLSDNSPTNERPIKPVATTEIFGMVGRLFAREDGKTFILFRAAVKSIVNVEWIQQIVNTFNTLLDYKRRGKGNSPIAHKVWPVALAILAATCSFHFLQNDYAQVGNNPLTDDQKKRSKEKLTDLRNILEKICKNLRGKQIEDFNGNLGVLQTCLEKFEPFVSEMNSLLESKIQSLNEDKERLEIICGVTTISAVLFAGTLGAYWKLLSITKKVVGSGIVVCGSLCPAHLVILLRKMIDEHDRMHETVKSLTDFLSEIRASINEIDIDQIEDEIKLLLDQFKKFQDKIGEYETKISL
ncbi:8483_t:CDS:2, partial [Ambispora leptoticha]